MTYPADWLGDDVSVLDAIADGTHPFAKTLEAAEKPMIIVGNAALNRADSLGILGRLHKIASDTGVVAKSWNGFNVLHQAASRVAGLDMGFVPAKGGLDTAGILAGAEADEIGLVWLLAADELDTSKLANSFVVYQGHHGDKGAHCADIVLPGAAYTEKEGTYLNFEGRVQRANRATFPPGDAKEDWKILRAFSEVYGTTLKFDTVDELREELFTECPHFADLGDIKSAKWSKFGTVAKLSDLPLRADMESYYMTCPISRASETMADCRSANGTTNQIAAE